MLKTEKKAPVFSYLLWAPKEDQKGFHKLAKIYLKYAHSYQKYLYKYHIN